ncbi:MAG TPA: CBS domain-containing protein [Candidatus Acidoferrales bacterium]|nr:CBS domain-containing protein [Candidatus Acidoferrales bacterium]
MARDGEITVREIMMSHPVTLGPDDTLETANDLITLGRIRHVPILENGRLVGILSQRQLLGPCVGIMLGVKGKTKKALLKSFRVKELMCSPVFTISPEATLKEAARLMAEKRIGCLPVVDGSQLVGLITVTDILRHVAES